MNNGKNLLKRVLIVIAVIAVFFAVYLVFRGNLFRFNDAPSGTADRAQEYLLRVVMLDVGQGDSILVSSGGQHMLIDAGENDMGDVVVAKLRSLGVDRLAAVVGTHPHSDHIGGIDTVLKAFPVDVMYLSPVMGATRIYEEILDAAGARNISVQTAKPGGLFSLGKANITCLWPPEGSGTDGVNNSSVVLLAEAGGYRVLLTGDIEKDTERSLMQKAGDYQCDVLKVAHHGSDTSSTRDFLKRANPRIALISLGEGNNYQYPDHDVLRRLHDVGAEVHRTDINGTISVTIFNGRFVVQDSKK